MGKNKLCWGEDLEPYWYKEKPSDKVWWYEQPGIIGEFIFSFDKKKKFYLYRDYSKMTPEEKAIFDKENPFWAEFFS
jgi:hypothetical protein